MTVFLFAFLLVFILILSAGLHSTTRKLRTERAIRLRITESYDSLASEFDARAKIDRQTRDQVRRIEAAVHTILNPKSPI